MASHTPGFFMSQSPRVDTNLFCGFSRFCFNFLATEKQTTKFSSANFLKNVKPKLYYIENQLLQLCTARTGFRYWSLYGYHCDAGGVSLVDQ